MRKLLFADLVNSNTRYPVANHSTQKLLFTVVVYTNKEYNEY